MPPAMNRGFWPSDREIQLEQFSIYLTDTRSSSTTLSRSIARKLTRTCQHTSTSAENLDQIPSVVWCRLSLTLYTNAFCLIYRSSMLAGIAALSSMSKSQLIPPSLPFQSDPLLVTLISPTHVLAVGSLNLPRMNTSCCTPFIIILHQLSPYLCLSAGSSLPIFRS